MHTMWLARPFRTLVNNIIEGNKQIKHYYLVLLKRCCNQAGAELMNPFISESIWTEAVTDIIVRGGRTKKVDNYTRIKHLQVTKCN